MSSRFVPQIGNKLFIHHCQGWEEGSFVCETLWFFSWVNTHPFDPKFVAFFPISVKILTWNFRKKLFQENFSEILCKTKAILYQNLWNFAQLSTILFWVRIMLKKFTQVLSYVICTQVGRHVHKQITEGRYGEGKTRTFCFRKTSFVHSKSGTYYALFLGYFGLKFLPDVFHCVCSIFAQSWAPDSSHMISNKLFIHHCQGWMEGSFVCETAWFFSWVNTHPFDPKFVVSGDSYMEFQEQTISREFFRNFVQTKGYPIPKLVKFRPTLCNFILSLYCAEKIHTSTFIFCLHPSKEARP